jgi:hypothetical protein
LIWEECGPCPFFTSYILAFALQLRKKQGKTSVRVEELQSGKKNLSQGSKTSVRVEKPQSIAVFANRVPESSRSNFLVEWVMLLRRVWGRSWLKVST